MAIKPAGDHALSVADLLHQGRVLGCEGKRPKIGTESGCESVFEFAMSVVVGSDDLILLSDLN